MKQSVKDHSSTKGTILKQTSIILNTWMIHDLKMVPDIHGLKMVHKHLELFSFLFIEFLDKMLKNTVSRDGARL